jgi:hypothetical protein
MHASCQHTHARTCRDHSYTLELGGDECEADSLSLLRQSYTQAYVHCLCVCERVYLLLFVCIYDCT